MTAIEDRVTYTPEMVYLSNERRIQRAIDAMDKKDPTIGHGIKVVGNKLVVDIADSVNPNNSLPATSNSLEKEFEKVDTILGRI